MIAELIETASFSHASQQLYRTEGLSEVGAEYLFRVDDRSPETIFQLAKEENRLFELDTLSIYKAVYSYFSYQELRGFAFINIYPSTIMHAGFLSFIRNLLEDFPSAPQHVILEIIESEQASNLPLFKERIDYLRQCGFQIAIDDVGKGWSSLSLIIELEPEFIKLDRYFSIDLASSLKKQKMIRLLLAYFADSNTSVVLEGIETTADLQTARSLGVPFCQGYLLAMPEPVLM